MYLAVINKMSNQAAALNLNITDLNSVSPSVHLFHWMCVKSDQWLCWSSSIVLLDSANPHWSPWTSCSLSFNIQQEKKPHLKIIERSKLREKKMQFVVADIYMPHNWMKF